ncbi:hypothetical protein D3C71_1933720 [compost metagenome]
MENILGADVTGAYDMINLKQIPSSIRRGSVYYAYMPTLSADLGHAPCGRGMALRLFLQRQRHLVIMGLVAERLAE